MNKIGRVAAIAAGVIVAVGVIGFLILKITFPPQKIKQLVLAPIEQSLGRPVELRSTGVSLFPIFGITLNGLEIANTAREGFSREPFVRLEKFVLSIKVMPLFSGKLHIGRIILDKPQILVEIDRAGSNNYDDLAFMASGAKAKSSASKKPGPPALPIPMSLDRFEIRRGTIIYDDMKGKQKFSLGTIEQRVRIGIDKELKNVVTTGQLVISDIEIRSKDIPQKLTGLRVTLGHDVHVNVIDGLATVNELSASFQKLSLNMSGTVSNLNTDAVYDLRLKTDTLAIRDIVAEIPRAMAPGIEKVKAEGSVFLDLRVAGSTAKNAKVSYTGAFVARGVTVKHDDFPKSVNNGNIDIVFNQEELNLRQFTLKVGDNPVAMRAVVTDFENPKVKGSLKALFNLDDVKDVATLPTGVTLGGKVNADILIDGRVDQSDPSKLGLQGKVVLDNVLVTTPELARPLSANGTIDLSSRRIESRMAVVIGSSRAKLTARITDFLPLVMPDTTRKGPRPQVEVIVDATVLNFDEMLPTSTPADKSAPAAVSQEPALLLAAPLPGIDFKAGIGAGTLVYSGFTVSNVSLDIRHRNDIAKVELKGGLYSGRLGLDIGVDARNHRNVKLDFAMELSRVQMNDFVSSVNDRFTGTSPLMRSLRTTDDLLYGQLSLSTKFSGTGGTVTELQNSLNGSIKASAENGRIAGGTIVRSLGSSLEKLVKVDAIEFSDLRAELRVRDGQLVIDTLTINSRIGELRAGGVVGFDGRLGVRLSDRLTKAQSDVVVSAQNKGKDALKGVFKGTAIAGAASSVIDQANLVPVDRDGRVTVKLGLGGTVSEPRVELLGFGAGSGKSSDSPKQAATEQLKQAAEQKVEELKQEVTKAAEQEIKKLEKKAEEELKKASPEVKKSAEDAAKKGAKALKKLF